MVPSELAVLFCRVRLILAVLFVRAVVLNGSNETKRTSEYEHTTNTELSPESYKQQADTHQQHTCFS